MKNSIFEFPMSEKLKDLVYGSYLSVVNQLHGPDSSTRNTTYTSELFEMLNINWNRWLRVSVTGSKGKGSTTVMLASILSAGGEHVGIVTSPHLRKFNERIRIDGNCVTDDELARAIVAIAPVVNTLRFKIPSPHYLGPGGVILALAAKIFEARNISVVIAEAGRGGEYDEVSLIKGNVSVITPIMLKHADKIGPGLRDIARTKTYITAP